MEQRNVRRQEIAFRREMQTTQFIQPFEGDGIKVERQDKRIFLVQSHHIDPFMQEVAARVEAIMNSSDELIRQSVLHNLCRKKSLKNLT